jgi:hypothetical protein
MSSPAMQVRSRIPRIASDAVERARLTVVPRRRTKAKRMPFIALVSMVLLGGIVGLLLFNTSMQQASFMAANLEDQATTLAARQQGLQMELDQLRDPQRIAGQAQKLGMVQACTPAFLELGTGKVTGQPCAGTAAVPFRINPLPPTKPASLDPKDKVVIVQGTSTTDPNKSGGDTGAGNQARGRQDGKKNQ